MQELAELIREDRQNAKSTGQEPPGLNYTLHQYGNQRCLAPDSIEDAAHMIQLADEPQPDSPAGLIVQFTSQMVARPDDLSVDETDGVPLSAPGRGEGPETADMPPKEAGTSRHGGVTVNQMFLLTDKLNDLPAWFYLAFPQLKDYTY